ncbi:MAG: FlgD immunoglobulin-like domain containing protein, partial [Candidatus Krumholzibacteriia bacterium]
PALSVSPDAAPASPGLSAARDDEPAVARDPEPDEDAADAGRDDEAPEPAAAGAGQPDFVDDEGPPPPEPLPEDWATPNPLNPATVIAFTLPRDGAVRLQVFDLKGRVVRTLVDGPRTAGRHQVRWDGLDQGGSAAASGTYLYRLVAGGEVSSRKLTLVR